MLKGETGAAMNGSSFRDGAPADHALDAMEDMSAADRAEAWESVRRRLRAELGEDVFSSWFGRLELDAISGDVARLTVPTRFLKSWIEANYLDRVLTVFRGAFPGVGRLIIGVRSAGGAVISPRMPEPARRPA
ncbi:DnaA N-terminal domain-containing protein, partial [Camelimonas abortus]